MTVYYCDHCKKKMLRKSAMQHHEKWCYKNPENAKACDGCVHFQETEVTILAPHPYDGSLCEQKRKGFRCDKLDKLLYPLAIQRRGLDKRYPETFDSQEPMPKECEHQNFGF